MWQTVGDAVVYKFITVKTRQTIVSTEPEKATWIRNDFVHAVTRQTVSSRVGPNRKLFGAVLRTTNENEYEDRERSLHGADMIEEMSRTTNGIRRGTRGYPSDVSKED